MRPFEKAGMYAEMHRLLQEYDRYTADHSKQVAFIAKAIATQLSFSEELVEVVYLAALVHDIGKVRVPLEILNKPGKLTDEEYGVIKGHPRHGYDMLDPMIFPEIIRIAVLSHHERIDGKGYPNNASCSEIDKISRILAVADVFDALVSDRPYRKGMAREKAIRIMRDDTGTHFCPEVIEAFLMVEPMLWPEGIYIYTDLQHT